MQVIGKDQSPACESHLLFFADQTVGNAVALLLCHNSLEYGSKKETGKAERGGHCSPSLAWRQSGSDRWTGGEDDAAPRK